jgi:F-type H+-transporting ATPase subunit b
VKDQLKRSHVIAGLTATLLLVAASVAFGAEGHADSGALLKDFLYRCFNFAVTFGLLAYFVTKPLRNGLAGRRQGIEKALTDAEQARTEAEARFVEYDRKLAKAAEEIATIHAEIRREGELESQKIVANAHEMAEKIKAEAKKSAANEVARARAELQREAAHMAVALAEDLLNKNFTPQDQDRLVNEYMQKVGELH